MAKDGVLQVRIDPELKAAAETLYASMGTSLSEAVRMFINQSVIEQQFPFTPTSLQKKGKGRAFGTLEIFGSIPNREEEREAWISSLSAHALREIKRKG